MKRTCPGRLPLLAVAGVSLFLPASTLWGARIVLKDGRVLEGDLARLTSLTEQPQAAPDEGVPNPRLIVLIDDHLRRYFIPKSQVAQVNHADLGAAVERFKIRQPVARHGGRVAMIGPILRITSFDEHGRRILEMNTNQGIISVMQGITEITPTWVKVEALDFKQGKDFLWDQRIAFSSIPRETLNKILARQIDPTNIEHRLKLVRLYVQAERYRDARDELEAIVAEFQDRRQQFTAPLRDLDQSYARRALAEIEVRKAAGQHRLAQYLLEHFPTEGVAGETLQAIREMREEYVAEYGRVAEVLANFDAHLAQLSDSALIERIRPIREELGRELGLPTLARMAAYRQLWDDPALTAEDKLALAISGWVIGSDAAIRRLPVALSLVEVRALVRRYLSEEVKLERNRILAEFASEEGATPELVAQILRHMTPPLESPEPVETPGLFELSVETLPGEAPVTYYVQLPPEYDPHRLYPAVVTLHGAGTTPMQQIDWWAGGVGSDGSRLGQATRHGYIVIAPAWGKEHQTSYNYTAGEHTAVLNPMRDACRRFSIDTDRVFLTGHSMGGDATWDIGVSHPDLWAGIIPVVALAERYVHHYWENARYVPLYLVAGELDGDKAVRNAMDLDRYMNRGYNVTVAEFQGRGHENFSDEILRLLDWMGRCERDFHPGEFNCRSMRTWDNFFWWLELADFPEKAVVHPENWPPPRGTNPVSTRASLTATNGVNVRTGAAGATVWLSPEIVDFKRPVSITFNGGKLRGSTSSVAPDLGVLLEDARTRADRQHPFWAKVEMPSGKVNGSEP